MTYSTHLLHMLGLIVMVTASRDSHSQEDKQQEEEVRSHSKFVINPIFVETPNKRIVDEQARISNFITQNNIYPRAGAATTWSFSFTIIRTRFIRKSIVAGEFYNLY